MNAGHQLLAFPEEHRGAKQKHPRVPVERPRCDHLGRAVRIGLFDEPAHIMGARRQSIARLDIAKPGRRLERLDAKGHQSPVERGSLGNIESVGIGIIDLDPVVRGKDVNQNIVRFAQRQKTGRCNGRCRVAGNRFKNDSGSLYAHFLRLFGHQEAIEFVGDDDRSVVARVPAQPQKGLLQQAMATR